MRVASWNAKVGRPDDEFADSLRALIRDTDPDVICLQEAGKYTDTLRRQFGDRWYVYAKDGWDESTMNPVLVRRTGRRKKKYDKGWGTIRTKTVWEGPQGGNHRGRTWTYTTASGMRIMSLHRCTGGREKNKEAFVEEYDVLTAWIDEQTKPVLVIGDHNCGTDANHRGSSKRVAEATTGRLIADADDPGIDYALVLGVPGKVRRGKSYGSDHDAVVFTTR